MKLTNATIMYSKRLLCIFASLIGVLLTGCGHIEDEYAMNKATSSLGIPSYESSTVWKEVPIVEGKYSVAPIYSDFDLAELIADADYIFSGKVVGRKEYEVSWNDENGKSWGPYWSSIAEVEIINDYYGESPVEGTTLEVYIPESFSAFINGSFQLNEDSEYIFISKLLDEDFVEYKKKNVPDDKFEQEKHADVYVTNLRDNIINISDNDVVAYREFFSSQGEVLSNLNSTQIASLSTAITEDISCSDDFKLISKDTFDMLFYSLLDEFKMSSSIPEGFDVANETVSQE